MLIKGKFGRLSFPQLFQAGRARVRGKGKASRDANYLPIGLSMIAVTAGCDEVGYIITPTLGLRNNVINVKNSGLRSCTAITATVSIPCQYLEPK